MDEQNASQEPDSSFQKKVWIAAAITALIAVLILFFNYTFNVLLLVLAGTLIAIFFRAISSKIESKTNWKEGVCLTISILGTLLIVAGMFWLIGSKVHSQLVELTETLPKTVENVRARLNESSIGEKVLERATSDKAMSGLQSFAQRFFRSTFGVVGDVYVVLFIAIFFTVSPRLYTGGFVQLIPPRGQEEAKGVLKKLHTYLRKWLKGKLISMSIVFVLTAIGLAIIGVDLWLVLALFAGLISFIPNFGPVIALIPAVLVGLLQGQQTALLIVGLYVLVQFIESNFITTLLQQKLVNMPPALILIAQLFMGTLVGGWGVVLATPVTLIVMILVQELYIKRRDGSEASA